MSMFLLMLTTLLGSTRDRGVTHGDALLRCDPLTHVYCPGISWPSDEQRARHLAASPFPHTIIDHFLPPVLLDAALDAVVDMDPRRFVREPALGAHQQRKQRLVVEQIVPI